MDTATSNEVQCTVPYEDALAFLFWAGEPMGRDPGQFKVRLIKAIIAADEENRELLRVAYPGLLAAVELYRKSIDWLGLLRDVVREPLVGRS